MYLYTCALFTLLMVFKSHTVYSTTVGRLEYYFSNLKSYIHAFVQWKKKNIKFTNYSYNIGVFE